MKTYPKSHNLEKIKRPDKEVEQFLADNKPISNNYQKKH